MKVELLSPLHIGTGNEVPDFEYQWDEDNRQLLRISLMSILASNVEAQAALNQFSTRDGVMRYLKNSRASWDEHLLYWLEGEGEAFDIMRSESDNLTVRECLKASFGNYPLLPGSSLKGALLTGWLFSEAWEHFSESDQAMLLNDKTIDFNGSIEDKLYDRLTRGNPEWGMRTKAELPNLLSDRLWVSDIELKGDFDIYQAKRKTKTNDLALWIECVSSGATGVVRGRFKEEKGGSAIRTVAELCRRCNTFTECVLVAEQQFFDYCIRKSYLSSRPPAYLPAGPLISRLNKAKQSQNSCLLRVGWASTKNATSLTLLNSSANLSLQPEGRANPRRRPKSRWTIKNGEPLGWCLVTFEESDYE